jgi:hypothetical protein
MIDKDSQSKVYISMSMLDRPIPRASVALFDRYVNVEWFGDYEDYDPTAERVAFLLTRVD